MESRTKKVSRSIFWGTFSKVISTLLPFAIRTIMIYKLGIEYTGLNSLFTSLLNVLSLTELGIGSALVFSMYKPIDDGDTEKVCALLNFYKKCYRVVGCIILALGIAVIPFLDFLVEGDVPSDINLTIIYIVNLSNTVLSYFLFAYRNSLFLANQRMDIREKISLFVNLLMYFLQIAALLFLESYYVYIVILPVMTCLNNIIVYICSKKVYPQYVPKGTIDKDDIGGIKKRVTGLICSKIGNVVLTSVDTIVISSFLGLTILGIYNGYYCVISTLFGLLAVVQNSMVPSVGNSIVKESKEKNYNDFKKFHFIYVWLISWWCSCLVPLYQPFIQIWQGSKNMLNIQMVILFGIYFYIFKMGDIIYIYREAIGLWWRGKLIPLIAALFNLIVNIILVNTIGLPGILISTIVSILLIHTPGGSWILFKYYFNNMRNWVMFILSLVIYGVVCFGVTFVTYMICSLVPQGGWGGLIEKIIICTVLPNILLFIIYHRFEVFKDAYGFVNSKFVFLSKKKS